MVATPYQQKITMVVNSKIENRLFHLFSFLKLKIVKLNQKKITQEKYQGLYGVQSTFI